MMTQVEETVAWAESGGDRPGAEGVTDARGCGQVKATSDERRASSALLVVRMMVVLSGK